MNPLHYSVLKTDPPTGGSRAAATSKIERFVMVVNGWNLRHERV